MPSEERNSHARVDHYPSKEKGQNNPITTSQNNGNCVYLCYVKLIRLSMIPFTQINGVQQFQLFNINMITSLLPN